MKKFTQQTRNKLASHHDSLSRNFAWYKKWHDNPYHNIVHHLFLIACIIGLASGIYSSVISSKNIYVDQLVATPPQARREKASSPQAGRGQPSSQPSQNATADAAPQASAEETPDSTSSPQETPPTEAEIITPTETQFQPIIKKVTSPILTGKFKSGIIPVTVSFSENVFVTGIPQLILSTGDPATTAINYKSGSGTDRLIFTYKIASGNFSQDLDYDSSSALNLSGGSIKNKAGIDADLTLPNPGSSNSLSAYSNIIIDTAK